MLAKYPCVKCYLVKGLLLKLTIFEIQVEYTLVIQRAFLHKPVYSPHLRDQFLTQVGSHCSYEILG